MEPQKERKKLARSFCLMLSGLVPFLCVFLVIFLFYFADMSNGIEREERQFGRHETSDQEIVLYAAKQALPTSLGAGLFGFLTGYLISQRKKKSMRLK
jgi:ABC-type sulfate transport system permease component